MKAFARQRHSNTTTENGPVDVVEDEPVDPSTGDDFIQRLGDLDQFIGTATVAPTGSSGPTTSRLPGAGAPLPLRNGSGNLPATPSATRRLFDARLAAADQPIPEPASDVPATEDTSEADDFLQRLGDLDRFIAPPSGSVPVVAPSASPARTDDEASGDDFLQRLGDLDRFIGGGNA